MKTTNQKLVLLAALIAGLPLLLMGQASAQSYSNVHLFNYPDDGAKPQAGLILSGNTLYGTTSGAGGNLGYGTVFKVNLGGSGGNGTVCAIETNGLNFTNVYSFSPGAENDEGNITNGDGASPEAALILADKTLLD